MIRSRIREIRKSKGLTLQDVADRIGTTAQTIGRLETGMRTLSIKWVRRIAEALETDPGELLALSGAGDIDITGSILANGGVKSATTTSIALRFSPDSHIALQMGESLGPYNKGDTLVFRRLDIEKWETALGNDCIVEGADGNLLIGRLASIDGSTATLMGLAAGIPPQTVKNISGVALLTTLIRSFAS